MSAYAIFIRKAARRSVLANDGRMSITRLAAHASDDCSRRVKALVLEAMTSLFQRYDAPAVDRLYAQGYIQHNSDFPQGRDALQALVAALPRARLLRAWPGPVWRQSRRQPRADSRLG